MKRVWSLLKVSQNMADYTNHTDPNKNVKSPKELKAIG